MDRLQRQSVLNSMGAETIPPGVSVLAWQMLVTHLVEKRRWSTSMLMIVSAGCKTLVGQGLNEDQMLSVIRGAITRNTFDLPQVHTWLEQNRTERFAHKKVYGPRTNEQQGQAQGVVSRVMRQDRVAELEAQIIGNAPKAGVA
jgi:cell division FtsZ-interacting protein ZapD